MLKKRLKIFIGIGIILILLTAFAQILIFDVDSNKDDADENTLSEEDKKDLSSYQQQINNADGCLGIPFSGKYRISSFFGPRSRPTPRSFTKSWSIRYSYAR